MALIFVPIGSASPDYYDGLRLGDDKMGRFGRGGTTD